MEASIPSLHPLADDFRNILMQELYALKLVSENDIDSLFMEVERITERYLKASIKEDPMLEQWIMAAILRNLPKQLTRDLALELKKVTSIDDIHNSINIYMYDHQIGMPRNMPGPMLCITEKETQQMTKKTDPTVTTLGAQMLATAQQKHPNPRRETRTTGNCTLLARVERATEKARAKARDTANVGTVESGVIQGGSARS